MDMKYFEAFTKRELHKLVKKYQLTVPHKPLKEELVSALINAGIDPVTQIPRPEKSRYQSSAPEIMIKPNLKSAELGSSFAKKAIHSKEPVYPANSSWDIPENRTLPHTYGQHSIVLMPRDEKWVYAYWELQPQLVQKALTDANISASQARWLLRLFDISQPEFVQLIKDMPLQGQPNNWYLDVPESGRSYYLEIGFYTPNHEFITIARSNPITMPTGKMSSSIDENWSMPEKDLANIYNLAGVDHIKSSPSSFAENKTQQISEYLQQELSSGNSFLSSLESSRFSSEGLVIKEKTKNRKFWFVLDAELIVYGATEPDATVTCQGQPVSLRSDGTFTLRFQLPDGLQHIPVIARSNDGIEKRTIALDVERKTSSAIEIDKEANEKFLLDQA